MSKSLGNFFTVREILAKYDPEVVRFFIVRAQYRSPLNYSDHHLDDAKQGLTRLYTALKDLDVVAGEVDWGHPQAAKFRAAMNDDFNTPEAVAVLFELANEVNKSKAVETARLLKSLGAILGLLTRTSPDYFQRVRNVVVKLTGVSAKADAGSMAPTVNYSDDQIEHLIEQRAAARRAKTFAESDRIRKLLLDAGIVLEDTAQGTTWRRS